MSDEKTDFDQIVEEVAEDMENPEPAPEPEPDPAVEVQFTPAMVEIKAGVDCPFVDCIFGDMDHLHFTDEPQHSPDE